MKQPVKVVNINNRGEQFDPCQTIVKRADNPALYKYLEKMEAPKK